MAVSAASLSYSTITRTRKASLGVRQDSVDRRSIGLLKSVSSGSMKVKANGRGIEVESMDETTDTRPLTDPSCFGKILPNGLVFQQSFPIRSYEIGADRTTSIEWFMNHLQETAVSHVRAGGLQGDGLGSTEAMSRLHLIWVMTKMHIVVDRYPSWGDVVQVDTWGYPNGKNRNSRDWRIYNRNTGEPLARASGSWVMMNTSTRRLVKIPDDVHVELNPFLMYSRVPIVEDDRRKLPKLDESTADCVQDGLIARWCDLDLNQHVNNTKYVGWILESCATMLESHELVGLTLEFRKECLMGDVMQSLTALSKDRTEESRPECIHLLRLENGAEIVRARTAWRPKLVNMYGVVNGV